MMMLSRRVALALVPFAMAAFSAAEDKPLTIDQIVAKHIEARGGIDKIKAIQSLRMSGNIDITGQIQAPMTIVSKRPNLSRFDMDVNGQSFTQAFDGSSAWMVNPFMGAPEPQKSPDADNQGYKDRADIDGPLVDYKAKGNAIELQGTEDVAGTPSYKLKVTRKSGSVDYIYLDAKTFLDSKMSGTQKQMGEDVPLVILFSNFKPVNGVMMPHTLDQTAGPMHMVITLDKIETNVALEDTMFQMPEKKAEEAKPAADSKPAETK